MSDVSHETLAFAKSKRLRRRKPTTCSCCQIRPPKPGQYYCGECRLEYDRIWRADQKKIRDAEREELARLRAEMQAQQKSEGIGHG